MKYNLLYTKPSNNQGGFLTMKINSLKFKNVHQLICKAEVRQVCPMMTPLTLTNPTNASISTTPSTSLHFS